MAENDYRVKTSWVRSRKRRKLQRRLGPAGPLALMDLWGYCADFRPDGDLVGMSIDDIEAEAYWEGEQGAFVGALEHAGLLDGKPGEYRLHDWAEHQPWLAGATDRSEQAKRAAEARWAKHAASMRGACGEHAGSINQQSGAHADSMRPASISNAPSPSLPTPSTPGQVSSTSVDSPSSGKPEPGKGKWSDQVRAVWDFQRKLAPGSSKVLRSDRPEYSKIVKRLQDGYSPEEICRSLVGWRNCPFHNGDETGKSYLGINTLLKTQSKVAEGLQWYDKGPPETAEEKARREFLGDEYDGPHQGRDAQGGFLGSMDTIDADEPLRAANGRRTAEGGGGGILRSPGAGVQPLGNTQGDAACGGQREVTKPGRPGDAVQRIGEGGSGGGGENGGRKPPSLAESEVPF